MQFVLEICFFFVLVGLVSVRFDRRQQAVVGLAAVFLAVVQFMFARFL
jgi:hypothetical protein